MNILAKAIVESLGIDGIFSVKIDVGSYCERPKLLLEVDYTLYQDEVNRRMEAMKQTDTQSADPAA